MKTSKRLFVVLLAGPLLAGAIISPVAAQDPIDPNTTPPPLELTSAGWLGAGSLQGAENVSALAVNPVDCATMTAPVVGFEISRGQDSNDNTAFLDDLVANGYSVGSVDISGGTIPPCVDILIVQGSSQGFFLSSPYSAADGALLKAWTTAGHGLMLSGEFGSFQNGTAALFQAYGYTQQGTTAATDPTDFDPAGPDDSWIIYQADNFASHPILNGITSLELLASSWIIPNNSNVIVTTDADAVPPGAAVMAAFTDGAGCAVLTTDSNWNSVIGTVDGYFKQDNAQLARQMVGWLNSCQGLGLSKVAVPNPVQAGQVITYTLTAGNNGLTNLTGVLITDTIPASTTFVDATLPHTGPDANGMVSWSLGGLAAGAAAAVTMAVRVDNAVLTGSVIANTGWVASSQGLTNTATAVTVVNASPPPVGPLTLTKLAAPNPVQAGQLITYSLVVSNAAGTVTNVHITDTIPASTTFVDATLPHAGPDANGVIDWSLGALAANSAAAVTLLVRVDGMVLSGTTVANTAWVSSAEALTATASASTRVVNPVVNPVIAKAVSPGQVRPGEGVTFTLSLQQLNSTSDATNVQITDPISAQLEILNVQATMGAANVVGHGVVWSIPVLPPAGSGSLTILTRVSSAISASITLTNQAILSFDQGADRPSNLVTVFVSGPPASAPTPSPTPIPTSTPASARHNDDDPGRASVPPPAPPLPAPVAIAPAPAPNLPVMLLPETGYRPVPWLIRNRLIVSVTLLVIGLAAIILKRNSR